ncbi:hypothetical protein CVT25_000806 [Psilocybe cyanescens]|uniref:Uncharacterized protein n=1 Tax=Psilocybe cyanescens TaxID=93625 RepID=A0A409WEK8_PSICY|nr:hypothetical protein CVT25_000806 [Psilocybe cyanescens]
MKPQDRDSYFISLSRADTILTPPAIVLSSSTNTPSASIPVHDTDLHDDREGERTPFLVDFADQGEKTSHVLRVHALSSMLVHSHSLASKKRVAVKFTESLSSPHIRSP